MSFATGTGLIFLRDEVTGHKFLVDTGASLSILPHQSHSATSGPKLVGADGKAIPAWGFRETAVQFGPHKFTFKFLLAAVASPILGFDFLAKHGLCVSPPARRVL